MPSMSLATSSASSSGSRSLAVKAKKIVCFNLFFYLLSNITCTSYLRIIGFRDSRHRYKYFSKLITDFWYTEDIKCLKFSRVETSASREQ